MIKFLTVLSIKKISPDDQMQLYLRQTPLEERRPKKIIKN